MANTIEDRIEAEEIWFQSVNVHAKEDRIEADETLFQSVHVHAKEDRIEADETWFQSVNVHAKELLDCFRNHCDSSRLIDQLEKVLTSLKEQYGSQNENTTRDIYRKKWRDNRIQLYNNLLLLALGAEGQEWKSWYSYESGTKLSEENWYSKLVPGSIYAYLLDIIHEDEEIMFKFYRVGQPQSWRKRAFWLVESIRIYRKHLIRVVVNAMSNWDEENQEACKVVLVKAKQVFKKTVATLGRSWSERSWRNRARLYWLLGLAKQAPISNGRLEKFKNVEYVGPIGILVKEMIQEDEEMLSERDNGSQLVPYVSKAKFEFKGKRTLLLGRLMISRLLAWASAANDHDLVVAVSRRKDVYVKSAEECDYRWPEDSWKESWAMALWNAAYKGYAQIVEELLKCKFPYHVLYSTYFAGGNNGEPPLHVAVRKGHVSVVDAFCTATSMSFSCNKENADHQTPLELAWELKNTDSKEVTAAKTEIQSILIQRSEVKGDVQEYSSERDLMGGLANAIVLGATLIATLTYGGWLQPPLSYSSYYQFTESLPAPPDSYESYMSIQGHTSIEVFAVFNSLSFFFAIAAVVAGLETYYFKKAHVVTTVKKLRYKIKWTASLFVISMICVLIAFASAGIAILPPIEHYQSRMHATIGIGGTICLACTGRFLYFCFNI